MSFVHEGEPATEKRVPGVAGITFRRACNLVHVSGMVFGLLQASNVGPVIFRWGLCAN